MIGMDKVREVLTRRYDALAQASEDASNQIGYFNEQIEQQAARRRDIWDESDSIDAALKALEAAFPTPVPAEAFDDIPF